MNRPRFPCLIPGVPTLLLILVTTGCYSNRYAQNPMAMGSGAMLSLESQRPHVISPSQDDFAPIEHNPFLRVQDHPLSTFSIDVDTASYSVMRRFLTRGELPPKDAIRIEELVNYFQYEYPVHEGGHPFGTHMALATCPWAPDHHLLRIALQGKDIPISDRPPLNLVFLLDVSGSMAMETKLPLVKRAMKTLVRQLQEHDRVAIVVYAGAAGLVLPSTAGNESKEIMDALDRLRAGGGTAGGAGIQLAYRTAEEHLIEGGVNRVILCTDGDFNVGIVQRGDLETLIQEKAKNGVQLSVLGFGMGNYKDSTLESLSNKGNGNYAYIDTYQEAQKVLVTELLGTLVTIAKDVKIQVEFNPAMISAYKLIGYENRLLRKEDFNNDKVDAGEIGAGHQVTALYELIPSGGEVPDEAPDVDPLKYSTPREDVGDRSEFLTLKLRHKQPDGEVSVKQEVVLHGNAFDPDGLQKDPDFQFAASVAAFGLWLRDPDFREGMTLKTIEDSVAASRGEDPLGYRNEFLQLVRSASTAER